VLFTESGDAGGQHYKTMLFDNTSHSSRTIGVGRAMALSPDGRLALAMDAQDNSSLTLFSLPDGSSKRIPGHGVRYQWARFLPHDEILAGASDCVGKLKLFRQSTAGGAPVPVAGLPYLDFPSVAPDGCKVVGRTGSDVLLLDVCRKSVRTLTVPPGVMPGGWSADSRSVVLATASSMSPTLLKLELGSNTLTKWKPLRIPEAASARFGSIAAAPDAGAYAYTIAQQLSRLYIVDDLVPEIARHGWKPL
jgi:Tol biopolymer transport system component